jgi:hypothetical protein
MMGMVRIVALGLVSIALCAQEGVKPAGKPPAKADQALRARVGEFYQDFVTSRFRDAAALVAKDTQDYFFTIKKEQYFSFEIQDIVYSDNFKRAQVNAICERNVMLGFAVQPMKLPTSSTWKLEGGKWYWYVDQSGARDTPFGKMTGVGIAGAAARPPGMPAALPTSPDFALHKVSADKGELALRAGESDRVTFANSAAGVMSVALEGKPEGLEVTPERADLQQNGKASLTVKALDGAKTAVLSFRVNPTGEIIAVKVNIR